MHPVNMSSIDHFGHAIEIDQQAQKDLVSGGTIFEDAVEIAEDGDARHILAVESQHARGLRAKTGRTIRRRYVLVDLLVVHVVGGRDLGEETGHHFNDVGDGHGANLVQVAGGSVLVMILVLTNEFLDMRQVANLYATWRCDHGAGERRYRAARRLQSRRIRSWMILIGRHGIGILVAHIVRLRNSRRGVAGRGITGRGSCWRTGGGRLRMRNIL